MRRAAPPLTAFAAGLLAAFAAGDARAQAPRRDFNCVGAEELEDEVFAVPFAAGSSRLAEAARSGLAAAAEAIRDNPGRGVCVLGHSDREGGQSGKVRLAAARARAVSDALTREFGVEAAQLRAEARVAGFSGRTGNRPAREAVVVVLPSLRPAAALAPVPRPATPAAAPPRGAPERPAVPAPSVSAPEAAPGRPVPAGPAPSPATPPDAPEAPAARP